VKTETDKTTALFDREGDTPFCTDYANQGEPLTAEMFKKAGEIMQAQVQRPLPWTIRPSMILFLPGTPRSVVRVYLVMAGLPYTEDQLALFPEEEPLEEEGEGAEVGFQLEPRGSHNTDPFAEQDRIISNDN